MSLDALNAEIAKDEAIVGSTLKEALHNLEAAASTTVAKCIQGHDPTIYAQEVQKFVSALKGAYASAFTQVKVEVAHDAPQLVADATELAKQEVGVVVKDEVTLHAGNIGKDVIATAETSQLAADAVNDAGAIVENLATDANQISKTL